MYYFKNVTWTGKKLTPKPKKVLFHGISLIEGEDYKLTYKNNVNVGEGRCYVKGIGDYGGSKWEYFKIIPKGTSVNKLTSPRKGQLKVTWSRQSNKMGKSRINGYYVQIATNKSFTQNEKTVYVKGYSKVSYTFKSLKSGKKYYARVRTKKGAFKSKWSSAKSFKVK